MGAFAADLRREWRDRRGAALGLVALVPALVGLAWPLCGGTPSLDVRESMPGAALLLAFAVLGSDAFSHAQADGPWALVLRTPGTFWRVFTARLLVLALALSAALAAEEAARRCLEWATGAAPYRMKVEWTRRAYGGTWSDVPEQRRLYAAGPFSFPRTVPVEAYALAIGAWLLASSAWTTAGRAGSLLGLGSLAAVVAPFAALHASRPYAFLTRHDETIGWALGVAALGVVVLGISYLLGRRFLTRSRPGALAGLGFAAVACGTAGGLAWADAARWLDFGPESGGARLDHVAWLGTGGGLLFANFRRGLEHPHDWEWEENTSTVEAPAEGPGSPLRPFVIDLGTGSARPLGDAGERVLPVEDDWNGAVNNPLPWFTVRPVEWERTADGPSPTRWIEGRTGATRLVTRSWRAPDETLAWRREAARAISPWKDSKGRRTWLLDGRVERDGEPPTDRGSGEPDARGRAASGGWIVDLFGVAHRLDAESGETQPSSPQRADGTTAAHVIPLGGGAALVRGSMEGAPHTRGDEAWALLDIESRAERIAPLRAGEAVVSWLPEGRVLLLAPSADGNPARLLRWDPRTDERQEVRATDPECVAPGQHAWLISWLPSGRALLNLVDQDYGRPHLVPARSLYGVLDPSANTLTPLTPWTRDALLPVSVVDDTLLVAIEEDRRIVRYERGGAVRRVIWPRAETK